VLDATALPRYFHESAITDQEPQQERVREAGYEPLEPAYHARLLSFIPFIFRAAIFATA
jgi:hypothetical protein